MVESSSRDPSNHLSLARDLEEWHRRIDQEVTQRKEENKVLEEKFLADVHGLKPGTEWERVARSYISSLYYVYKIFLQVWLKYFCLLSYNRCFGIFVFFVS